MSKTSRPTGYTRLSPWQARTVLGVFLFVCAVFIACTPSPWSNWQGQHVRPPVADRGGDSEKDGGDVALYRAEIDRIRAGESYYEAAAAELPVRHYPTQSVFNWRTPLPMWLIAHLRADAMGKYLLGGLALALMLMAFEGLAREEDNAIRRPALCTLLLVGPLMPCIIGDLYVMPMVWGGVFIGLSITAYGINRPYLGVAFGLAAVFFRELALPYCVLAAGFAWWTKRRGELAAWMVGLAAWGALFGLHCLKVKTLIAPDAVAHAGGWLQFGGATFVVATVQMNAWLMVLPQTITAVYLAAALYGFAGWDTPLGTRAGLTVCMFMVAFSMVGQSFNGYWGCLLAPLLCFGVARFPASLHETFQAAALRFPSRRRTATPEGVS